MRAHRNSTIVLVIINLFILFSIEFCSRVLVWGISGNPRIFAYGFNSSVQLDIILLTPPTIDVFQYSTGQTDVLLPQIVVNDKTLKKKLWAFGGSTTQGYNCPSGQSSYPEKLEHVNHNYIVKNFGKGGTFSDYSFKELIKAIVGDDAPDIILWGNRINEPDVMYRGVTRNYDRLKNVLPLTTKGHKVGVAIFAHRLHKSFFNRSVAYHLVSIGYRRVMVGRLGFHPKAIDEPTVHDYQLALANYRLNTLDAIKYSTSRGIKFVIVLLPNPADFNNSYSPEKKKYEVQFLAQAKELAKENDGVSLIYTVDDYFNLVGDLSQFCDGAHWNTTGHETLAKIISDKLSE